MRIRRAAAFALTAGLALTTTGCGLLVHQATETHFDASDGVSAYLDDVTLANLIIFTDGDGPASLVFGAVNNGTNAQLVNIQLDNNGTKTNYNATITPGYTGYGFGDFPGLTIEEDQAPGSLQKVYIQAGDAEGVELDVPVLNADDWEFYEGLNPIASE